MALLRLAGRAAGDGLGGLVGRAPLLVPLTGKPGSIAFVTAPDGRGGRAALDPHGEYPDWPQHVAPAAGAAARADRGEFVRVPGGHYAPFLAAYEQAVGAELDFLRRQLLVRADDDGRHGPPSSSGAGGGG